jgi:hypothetical protein
VWSTTRGWGQPSRKIPGPDVEEVMVGIKTAPIGAVFHIVPWLAMRSYRRLVGCPGTFLIAPSAVQMVQQFGQ